MFAGSRLWKKLLGRRSASEEFALVRSKIERFRDLLAANNRALELIADAGEKLGGDYLFDSQYLRGLVDELEEAVRRIVYDLNCMTGDRYTDIEAVFERLRRQTRACLDEGYSISEGELVFDLSALSQDLSDRVGEKMARLGDLYRLFPAHVPPGFAVSAYACRRFLEENGVSELIESSLGKNDVDPASLEIAAAQIRKAIQEAKIPRDIARSIDKSIGTLERKKPRRERKLLFAVRSSALGEDGDLTFAGLHDTFLNIPREGALDAYKSVVASLFSTTALDYRRRHNVSLTQAYMGVGCMVMVPAAASGVVYTIDPLKPNEDYLVIATAPGYGKSIVDGDHSVDRFTVSRKTPRTILSQKIAAKERMYVSRSENGLASIAISDDKKCESSVSNDTLLQLADLAMSVERFAKCAQDIEWTQDAEGNVFLLQTRPLRLMAGIELDVEPIGDMANKYPVLLKGRGEVAYRGIGAGPVCIVRTDEDRMRFPDGAVLVARNASPRLSALVPRANAVITDIGTAAGHLATIAREYRVPAIVDAAIAMTVLKEGIEITVDAEENIVYEGLALELLHYQLLRSSSYSDAPEFRILRRLLKNVAPLHLLDPRSKDFRAACCATYHDIIRFAHEKAVVDVASHNVSKISRRFPCCRELDLDLPIDLLVIDIDEDPARGSRKTILAPEEISCEPLCAILEGLTSPGAWATQPAGVDFGAFMSSATGPGSPDSSAASAVQFNLAILSREYLNLSLKLGYHFNVIDCYMSSERSDNYIYFRFTGGMTDLTRRSRRTRLIGLILEKFDFVTDARGDLVVARVKNLSREMMQNRLVMIGRLIGFTRQLDVLLKGDGLVEYYLNQFFQANRISIDAHNSEKNIHSDALRGDDSI
ncbi:MAG: PEP/pyruvate-binding domain-containing protein [Candidatus Omnitrophota bacterium]